jgi:type I restriction enzyme S subunit
MNLRFGAIGYSKVEKVVSVSAYYDILRLNEELEMDADYLEECLRSPYMLNIYDRVATGSLLEKKRVQYSTFKSLKVFSPPPKEQKKIGDYIRWWNLSIKTLNDLIVTKTQYKRGLMQQLLTGRKRFPEFVGQAWQRLALSDFARFTARITPKPDKPFKSLGIRSHGKGTFLKEDFEPQKIELTELYEVRENDLIVNITFAWEGAIAIAGAADSGALVSHRFPTYVFDTELAIPEYFRHVIVQKWFVEKLGLISPGGAGRNRVLSKKDFGKLEAQLPSVAEQKKIAAVLNACDRELRLLNDQLAALQRQKQGLMQKLLTGQVRVRVNDEGQAAE